MKLKGATIGVLVIAVPILLYGIYEMIRNEGNGGGVPLAFGLLAGGGALVGDYIVARKERKKAERDAKLASSKPAPRDRGRTW